MWKMLLTLTVALLVITSPVFAAKVAVKDNLGFTRYIETEEAAATGLQPMAAGIGFTATGEPEEVAAYDKHAFDLAFSLAAAGAGGDEDATSERALLGATLFWYPSDWMKFGPQMSWDQNDQEKLNFSIPVLFYLFNDPFSSVKWFFTVNPFTYSVRTDETGARDSAWSFNPASSFGVEFPMDSYSVSFALGAAYPFSLEGVTDPSVNPAVEQIQLGAAATINWRLGR